MTAVGSEILIDEFADFTQINGGYSDGTTAGETIILNEGVMFSFEILDNENYIAYGLYSEAQGVTLRNNGTIIANSVWDETLWEEVPEDPAGIAFFGKHGKIVNYGVLDINSPYGSGIQVGHQYPDIGLSGSDTTIWNYGKIFVDDTRQGDGYAHAGITAYTYRVGIFNAGEITIQADTHDSGSGFTYGIFSKAPYDLFISNAGTIKTYGKAGRGIYVELGVGNNEHFDRELQANARGTVVNSGLIEVFGGGNKPLPKNPYNSGIRIAYPGQGPQASVINTGTIKAHHPEAMGITAYSGRTHIINSGYVMGGHSAINTENGYTDVHLLAGSRLVGNIAFGAAPLDIKDRNRVTFGAGLNAIVRHTLGPVGINGVHGKLPNRIDAVDDAFLMAEDTVYALDLSTEQTARHRMMTGLGRNVSNGVRFAQCGGGGSGSGGGGLNLAGGTETSFWNQPFGSSIISDGDDGIDNVLIDDLDLYDPFDTYAAFEGGQVGSLFGFCDPLGSFRLFAGFMYGWVETSDSDHFDSESYGGFAGVQGNWTDDISYTFTTGYLHHDTDHEVTDSRLESGVTS
ncbi:MAG: hypothetical protein MJH08_16645, partial [Hyphomicrobiales bacterium]|nr:hypothetical protein [Hyphomicrobiales bacterium]